MPATITLPPRLTKAVKVLSKLCRSSAGLPAIAACILGQYLLPCQLKPLQSRTEVHVQDALTGVLGHVHAPSMRRTVAGMLARIISKHNICRLKAA